MHEFTMQEVLIYMVIFVILNFDIFAQALDLVPKKIHERSPIFLGSYDDVEEIKALYAAAEKSA